MTFVRSMQGFLKEMRPQNGGLLQQTGRKARGDSSRYVLEEAAPAKKPISSIHHAIVVYLS